MGPPLSRAHILFLRLNMTCQFILQPTELTRNGGIIPTLKEVADGSCDGYKNSTPHVWTATEISILKIFRPRFYQRNRKKETKETRPNDQPMKQIQWTNKQFSVDSAVPPRAYSPHAFKNTHLTLSTGPTTETQLGYLWGANWQSWERVREARRRERERLNLKLWS